MEFKLNEDQQLMKDMFVEFTEQFVKPIAAELDEQERFPEELIPQLGETGLLGIPVAEEYGGAGADNMSYVLAVEEVSKACASTGVTISAHTSLCCWPIEAFGTEEQKRKYLVPLAKGEKIGSSAEEGYIPNGVRVNFFEKERGSKRAVKMLIKKLNDKPYVTEYPMPNFDRVEPNLAVKDLAHAKIALVTSGGIVPKGNPDHIESSSASHYGEYDITGVTDLTEETYETAHGGYDPVYANEDPDRVLPVDVLRDMEKEGVIGSLHHLFYTTVGNGTSVASAKAFAAEYSQKLKADGVDAVILTST